MRVPLPGGFVNRPQRALHKSPPEEPVVSAPEILGHERGAGVALLAGWQTERMVACPTLETDRLVLRPFQDDDLADQFA